MYDYITITDSAEKTEITIAYSEPKGGIRRKNVLYERKVHCNQSDYFGNRKDGYNFRSRILLGIRCGFRSNCTEPA